MRYAVANQQASASSGTSQYQPLIDFGIAQSIPATRFYFEKILLNLPDDNSGGTSSGPPKYYAKMYRTSIAYSHTVDNDRDINEGYDIAAYV